MRLYVSSEVPTSLTITYMADGRVDSVAIPVARKTVEIDVGALFGSFVELFPINRGVSSKSFHIVALEDITLYGVSVRQHSADAFLGLPDDALTRRYVVLSYPNGRQFDIGYDQPSEFAVIATEDGTLVSVTPKALLNGHADLAPFSVGLNRGEVFFAQAALGLKEDVSGTQLRATKPIAVFSGNRRTSIPTSVGNQRDHLVEQMPPLDAWGTSAILAPHVRIQRDERYSAVARVVAADDNTTWEINGVPQAPLQSGEVREFDFSNSPLYVTASGPILVAQYEHSVFVPLTGELDYGDPFMMVIPPPEQYDTAYAFQSITHELFFRHFINVVVPNPAVTTLRLDGAPIVANYFPVPGTGYSYAQIELEAGSHYVNCDSAFGLYSYGYGFANSYGYPGGTLFRSLVVDSQHPYILARQTCNEVSGLALDNRSTDLGVDSCYIVEAESSNIEGTIGPFVSPSDSVFYSATLRDPYQDGVVTVKAIDSAGRSVKQKNIIPGYTVGINKSQGSAPLRVDLVSYNGAEACREIEIVNYGQFEHSVDELILTPNPSAYRISPSTGFTLAPGERRTVKICFEGKTDSVMQLSLTIGDSCRSREVVDMTIYSIIDTLPPSSAVAASACDGFRVRFSEPDGQYRGVADFKVEDLVNARLSLSPDSAGLPSHDVEMRLYPIDVYEDMIYRVRVADLAGNEAVFSDTVGGFTVDAFETAPYRQVSERLGVEWITDRLDFLGERCDTLLLKNHGARDLVIGSALLERNREFSVPPSQFPLTIPSGDSAAIRICLEGRFAGNQIDTLLIFDGCGRMERVPMKTPVAFGFGYGVDQCGQSLTVQAYAPSKRTFLTAPFPNPSPGGSVGLDIGLRRDESVTIDVVDMSGLRKLLVVDGVAMKGGVQRLRFDPSSLESGVYFCRMRTSGGEVYTSKLVLNR